MPPGTDSVMFRDTFLSGSGQKCLVLPFDPAKAGQKLARTGSKSGQYTAFLLKTGPENRFSVTFWSPFVAGIRFRRPHSSLLRRRTDVLRRAFAPFLEKRSCPDPLLNQPNSDRN